MSVVTPSTSGGAISALRLHQICKAFDGHQVLIDTDFDAHWGELHALLGENGAGKSTLMNTVCGLYTPDSGETWINDQPVAITQPADATRHRIGMVHQHYKLVDRFNVAENVLLACARPLGVSSISKMTALIETTAAQLQFSIDPLALTSDLSIAERQRVEIIKLIMLGADILILDEPTAVLTDTEAHSVLSLLRSLADQGKAVILITHRLKEVAQFANRVTVMRAGRTVLAGERVASLSESAMAQAMVGQSLSSHTPTIALGSDEVDALSKRPSSKARLSVQNLSVQRGDGRVAIDALSIDVHAGEIMGIAGVGGNGQTELAESLFGLHPVSSGCVLLDGEDLLALSIAMRRKRGLRLVPADRFAYALIAQLRAYENLALTDVPTDHYGGYGWLARGRMKRNAADQFVQRDITGGKPSTRSRLFSGGNAQKLLLARELSEGARMLIVHSPTRGLDVRAHQTVHATIVDSVSKGAACLLISEDLDEVTALSTRIAVLSRGRLHGPFANHGSDAIDRTRIGELMAGHA